MITPLKISHDYRTVPVSLKLLGVQNCLIPYSLNTFIDIVNYYLSCQVLSLQIGNGRGTDREETDASGGIGIERGGGHVAGGERGRKKEQNEKTEQC